MQHKTHDGAIKFVPGAMGRENVSASSLEIHYFLTSSKHVAKVI